MSNGTGTFPCKSDAMFAMISSLVIPPPDFTARGCKEIKLRHISFAEFDR